MPGGAQWCPLVSGVAYCLLVPYAHCIVVPGRATQCLVPTAWWCSIGVPLLPATVLVPFSACRCSAVPITYWFPPPSTSAHLCIGFSSPFNKHFFLETEWCLTVPALQLLVYNVYFSVCYPCGWLNLCWVSFSGLALEAPRQLFSPPSSTRVMFIFHFLTRLPVKIPLLAYLSSTLSARKHSCLHECCPIFSFLRKQLATSLPHFLLAVLVGPSVFFSRLIWKLTVSLH